MVDDDIDVYNPLDVERAAVARVGIGETGVVNAIVILQAPAGTAPRWGIDATVPLEQREWITKVRVPGIEKVDYI